jgi:hypothetical protein
MSGVKRPTKYPLAARRDEILPSDPCCKTLDRTYNSDTDSTAGTENAAHIENPIRYAVRCLRNSQGLFMDERVR